MNRNSTKKIRIDFGYIPRELISHEFTRPTQIQLGPRPKPHIECNITFMEHPFDARRNLAQIVFASSDEKKVWRIINKYNGRDIDVRTDLNQYRIEETNGSGKTSFTELANEIIRGNHRG